MSRTEPLYLSIEKDIRRKIEAGKLKSGQRLPAEESLSKKYNVSRMTLKKALSGLVRDGLLNQAPGRGTFVNSADSGTREDGNGNIALLVPNNILSVYAGITSAVEDVCKNNGNYVILGNYNFNREREQEYLESFIESEFRGIIACPSRSSFANPAYEKLAKSDIPSVILGNEIPGNPHDLVMSDFYSTGLDLAGLASEKGWNKGVFLSYEEKSFAAEEFLRGLKDSGINICEKIKADENDNIPLNNSLLANKDICIFSADEVLTENAVSLRNASGGNVGISGFCSHYLPNSMLPDFLVRHNRYDLGETAAEFLFKKIKIKDSSTQRARKKIFIETTICSSEEIISKSREEAYAQI